MLCWLSQPAPDSKPCSTCLPVAAIAGTGAEMPSEPVSDASIEDLLNPEGAQAAALAPAGTAAAPAVPAATAAPQHGAARGDAGSGRGIMWRGEKEGSRGLLQGEPDTLPGVVEQAELEREGEGEGEGEEGPVGEEGGPMEPRSSQEGATQQEAGGGGGVVSRAAGATQVCCTNSARAVSELSVSSCGRWAASAS